jgi:hypothetical protein
MPTEISGSTGVNKIQDNTIVNADINSSAAIAGSKISGGTGKVLQVVNVDNSSVVTISAGTGMTDVISGSITPSSTSSKILINFMSSYYKQGNSSNGSNSQYKIFRNSTEIEGTYWHYADATTVTNWWMSVPLMKLDSPSTTSSTTYKIQISNSGGASLGLQLPTKLILMEIAG